MPHLDSGFSHSKAINRPLCVCARSKRVLACWARICACTHVDSDMDRSRANHTINHRAGPAWHFSSPHTSTVIPFNVHCNGNTHAHAQTYSGQKLPSRKSTNQTTGEPILKSLLALFSFTSTAKKRPNDEFCMGTTAVPVPLLYL